MSDFGRAQAAHRAAFALITTAITDPGTDQLEGLLATYATEADQPGQALVDIAHALIWHAAGALFTVAEGDTDKALALVRQGAAMQELKREDTTDD
ncbi:hypothetical protein [Demequina rhizosphaerae]|uniref:hypothetical protein n=1 Tax=Demequina rhizosphaerae TaxID=1638985 RepID=UPI0007820ED4|nr:hypothetical protein [Demequina rhizosphaerae]